MKKVHKPLAILVLVALVSLAFVSSVQAFDGRDGDKVVIAADEEINDDLYVGATEFVLDGTVNGDVIAMAQTSTINGTIEGDLMAAGQTVIVNGTVTGAVRVAGYALVLGENASVGGDIIGAGYSLEVKKGSDVGQDIVFAGSQLLLAGDVARNLKLAGNGFELRGTVGGNVEAELADSEQAGPPPSMFMPQPPVAIPIVKSGITFGSSAKIEGDLEYTQSRESKVPAGAVAGDVRRNEPAVDTTGAPRQETTAERVSKWGINLLRSMVTLILIGLFLFWLFPHFMQTWSGRLQSAFWPSLGWGFVTYALVFFVFLAMIAVIIAGALFFGVLTLNGLAGTIVWLGILSVFALILGFVLVTSFVAKIVFGQALGRWILDRSNSPLATHRFWPMVIGVVITVAVIALFSFPLIPGFLGVLLSFVVTTLGFGALWLWGRERTVVQPVG